LAAYRRFQFQKRSQRLIRTHYETLPVAAMRVSDEYCPPVVRTRKGLTNSLESTVVGASALGLE
jgi:hypothetical protein